jgi:hypothetical protein
MHTIYTVSLKQPTYLTKATFFKYVGFFKDTVYQGPAHLYSHCTKKCLHFNHLTLLHHISCVKKVTDLVLWCTRLVWFPDDVPLLAKTCRNIQCHIVTLISKEEVSAFRWYRVVNMLSIMHVRDHIKSCSYRPTPSPRMLEKKSH